MMKGPILLKAGGFALIVSTASNVFAIEHSLRYYNELNTIAETGLKGNVKKVVTYEVPFRREWGEIKEGKKAPKDSTVFDNRGRALLKWTEYTSQYISWNGNTHTVKYSTPNYNHDEIYIYEYNGQGRLSAVTEKQGKQESKVFFKYRTDGGYNSTVYESIDSYGETQEHSSMSDDNYRRNQRVYFSNYDYDYLDSDCLDVKYDANNNWIEVRRYDDTEHNDLKSILVREIEYYRPGEPNISVSPSKSYLNKNRGPVEVVEIEEVKSEPTRPKVMGRRYMDDKVYTSVEQMPQYPGGDAALKADVAMNIRYPSVAQENRIEGKVVVQFVVTKNGSVGEVKVVRGKDPDLDKEAKRVVKTLKRFSPGKMNGTPVNVWYTLPVTFKLQNN